jgi:hypothetical protein
LGTARGFGNVIIHTRGGKGKKQRGSRLRRRPGDDDDDAANAGGGPVGGCDESDIHWKSDGGWWSLGLERKRVVHPFSVQTSPNSKVPRYSPGLFPRQIDMTMGAGWQGDMRESVCDGDGLVSSVVLQVR